MGAIEVSVRDKSGWTILHVDGDVDGLTAPELAEHLALVVDHDDARVVVDLRDVWFLDSTGLGALDRARRLAERHQGKFSLVADRSVRRVLDLTGLNAVFRIHRSIDEAVGP